jgi:SulP family sulfate permease
MMAEAEHRARTRGGELWLAGLNPGARQVVERAPLGKALGPQCMLPDLAQAVEQFRHRTA